MSDCCEDSDSEIKEGERKEKEVKEEEEVKAEEEAEGKVEKRVDK